MTYTQPEATDSSGTQSDVFVRYLDFFRAVIDERLRGLDDEALRTSLVPSGWTPLELLKHLVAMERRWFVWGFSGDPVDDPWADRRDGRWHVSPDETLAGLLAELHAGGGRTTAIIQSRELSAVGEPSDRWDGDPPARLERVCFHVLQEYARHAGHLDIVSELAGGPTD